MNMEARLRKSMNSTDKGDNEIWVALNNTKMDLQQKVRKVTLTWAKYPYIKFVTQPIQCLHATALLLRLVGRIYFCERTKIGFVKG